MNDQLRARLVKAGGAGVLAIAAVLATFYEGTEHKPYFDTGGVLTVCTGHTGPDIIRGKTYTDAECAELLRKDLAIANAGVGRVITAPLNKWQEAALTDFVFNLGEGALRSSTMAREFNDRDYDAGCRELARWVKGRVKGALVTLNGLVARRGTEEEICLTW